MVITPFGRSPNGTLHWPTVLLFSKIFPAFINFMSFAALGTIFLSVDRMTKVISEMVRKMKNEFKDNHHKYNIWKENVSYQE